MRHPLDRTHLSCQKWSQYFHFRDALAPPSISGFVSKPVAQCLKGQILICRELSTIELLLILGLLSLVPFPSFVSAPWETRPPYLPWDLPACPLLWRLPEPPQTAVLSRYSGPTDESWLFAFLSRQPACEFLEGRDHGLLILGSGTKQQLNKCLMT